MFLHTERENEIHELKSTRTKHSLVSHQQEKDNVLELSFRSAQESRGLPIRTRIRLWNERMKREMVRIPKNTKQTKVLNNVRSGHDAGDDFSTFWGEPQP
jgi:hypothetical protein